jgi:hypothetical protein
MTQFGLSDYICDFALEDQLRKLKPASVVDFGAGSGKNGGIVRRVLGNACTLIAIEGFGAAAQALQSAGVYDRVCLDLLQDWLEKDTGRYSVALFGDVIEHLTPGQVRHCMKLAMQKFDYIIIVAPLHDIFQEGAVYEGSSELNELEKHKTYITAGFFDRYRPIQKHVVVGEQYTIMNVLIQTQRPKKALATRAIWNAFHFAMLTLQPVGLARPTVDLLKMTMGRFKWIMGR